MKIKTSSGFTRGGGLIPIVEEIEKRKIPEVIDKILCEHKPRAKQAKYRYSDMVLTWVMTILSGKVHLDNVTELKKDLCKIGLFKIPSHDSLGYQMKGLVTETITENRINKTKGTNFKNQYNEHVPLNRLLIQTTLLMGGLNIEDNYTLDVDCTFISTTISGAWSPNKKSMQGFYPMICLINNMPVYVSMRNGNSTADYRQKECVTDCLELLEEFGIKVKTIRTDGAGYKKEYLREIIDRGYKFVTGTPVNDQFKVMFGLLNSADWKSFELVTANARRVVEITEVTYGMDHGEIPIRVIALRRPARNKAEKFCSDEEIDNLKKNESRLDDLRRRQKLKSPNKRYRDGYWKVIGDYEYKIISTNDWEVRNIDQVYFYNDRGTAEKNFSYLKKEFGWRCLAFSQMNQNTVFMIISSIANNIYRSFLNLMIGKGCDINTNTTVKVFKQVFVDFVARLIDQTWILLEEGKFHSKIC